MAEKFFLEIGNVYLSKDKINEVEIHFQKNEKTNLLIVEINVLTNYTKYLITREFELEKTFFWKKLPEEELKERIKETKRIIARYIFGEHNTEEDTIIKTLERQLTEL